MCVCVCVCVSYKVSQYIAHFELPDWCLQYKHVHRVVVCHVGVVASREPCVCVWTSVCDTDRLTVQAIGIEILYLWGRKGTLPCRKGWKVVSWSAACRGPASVWRPRPPPS